MKPSPPAHSYPFTLRPKHRRSAPGLLLVAVALVAITPLLWVNWARDFTSPDDARVAALLAHPATGEKLNLTTLAANERVEVLQTIHRHMRWEVRRYLFTSGPSPAVTMHCYYAELDPTKGEQPGALAATGGGSVTAQDLKGIETLLKIARLRLHFDDHFPWYDTFEVIYFRDGKKIGAENFFWETYHFQTDYDRLPVEWRAAIKQDDWEEMVYFENVKIDGYRIQIVP